MDAPIGDELFKRQTRDLAADGVKGRHGDRLGRVVDDEIDTRDGLERADVAPLTPDDAALHLIVGQRHDGNSGLGGVIGCAALDGGGEDLAGALIGFLLELRFDLLDLHGSFVPDLGFYVLEKLRFRLFLRQSRDLFQHFELTALDGGDFLLLLLHGGNAAGEFLFFLFVCVEFFIERFFLLL